MITILPAKIMHLNEINAKRREKEW